MILTLDVGNSQIFGGVYEDSTLKFTFRKSSKTGSSSDEMGIFLRNVLRENGRDVKAVQHIALCTVVPDLLHSLRGCCQKYFAKTPFVLQSGVKTGLNIRYRNPAEVGADRIANSIAAVQAYPGKNLIIVDFGTATTFCVITADKAYLGGMIIPGLRLSMEALESGTAKLPSVEILSPTEIVGRSTIESIQSGLYYGNLFMVREACREIKAKYFTTGETLVIGTGGFSRLFEKEGVFDVLAPDLVLDGLFEALKMNL
jgi:type III pantothenate kinase